MISWDMDIRYHQYIPCVEFDDKGNPMPYTVSGEEWGDFLCEIFDQWRKTDIYTVSVRLFDSILNFLINGIYTTCHLSGNCCQYFVVEYNGDIYPCDFFVAKELKLGNVMEDSWEDMLKSNKYISFGQQKQCGMIDVKAVIIFIYVRGLPSIGYIGWRPEEAQLVVWLA